MEIFTQAPLTAAQRSTLEAFEKVDVFGALLPPAVVAEFKTFQGQVVQVTIDEIGIIRKVSTDDRKELDPKQKAAIAQVINHLEDFATAASNLIVTYETVQRDSDINIDEIPGFSIEKLFTESVDEWEMHVIQKVKELKKLLGVPAPDPPVKKLRYTGDDFFLHQFSYFEESVSSLYKGVKPDGEKEWLDGTRTHEVYLHHQDY